VDEDRGAPSAFEDRSVLSIRIDHIAIGLDSVGRETSGELLVDPHDHGLSVGGVRLPTMTVRGEVFDSKRLDGCEDVAVWDEATADSAERSRAR
jgi:hypothetical protein